MVWLTECNELEVSLDFQKANLEEVEYSVLNGRHSDEGCIFCFIQFLGQTPDFGFVVGVKLKILIFDKEDSFAQFCLIFALNYKNLTASRYF